MQRAQQVTLTDATAGTAIYYTTNGSTPTTSATKYTGAITVAATETIQAIAVTSSAIFLDRFGNLHHHLPPPFGHLDSAVDSKTGSTTVSQNGFAGCLRMGRRPDRRRAAGQRQGLH